MSAKKIRQVTESVWLQWTLVNMGAWTIGWPLAIGTSIALNLTLLPEIGTEIMPGDLFWAVWLSGFLLVAGAATGFLVGSAQWFVLRHRIPCPRFSNWALVSALGSGLGLSLFGAGSWMVNGALISDQTKATLVAGIQMVSLASIGVLQWLILRHQIQRAGWWILCCTLGLGISVTVGSVLLDPILDLSFVTDICSGTFLVGCMVGLIFGATTGAPLAWLLRYPRKVVLQSSSE